MTELPEGFERPEDVDLLTVEAVGALTLAMETAIRARGAPYEFHQLTGKADNEAIRAVGLLRSVRVRPQRRPGLGRRHLEAPLDDAG